MRVRAGQDGIVRAAEQIVNAGVVLIGQRDQNLGRKIQRPAFITGIGGLAYVKKPGHFGLREVTVFPQGTNARIHKNHHRIF